MPNFSNYFVDLERPSRHRSHLTSIKHIRCQHGHAIRRIIVQIFRREGEAGQLIHGLAVVLIAAADIEEIPLRFYEQTIEFWGLFSVFFVWRCGGCLHVEPVFEVENL